MRFMVFDSDDYSVDFVLALLCLRRGPTGHDVVSLDTLHTWLSDQKNTYHVIVARSRKD